MFLPGVCVCALPPARSSPPSHLHVARSSQLQLCITSSTDSLTTLPTHTLHALALLSPPLGGLLILASCTSLPCCFVRSSPQSVKSAGMGGGKPCPSRPRSAEGRDQPPGGDLAFHSSPAAERVFQPSSTTRGRRAPRARPHPAAGGALPLNWPKATAHAPHRRRARSGAGPWRACAAARPRLPGGVGAMGLRASAAE